ncbi:hypothetical protein SEA_HIRKO_52 [Arthrobacter phage Hirko]|nr:hypothetical protein SEA_HIRKO_52 [Arthrobacter phage Hirko]
MTSQTPEEAERAELDEAVIDAVFMWEGTLEAPANFPGTLDEALAPHLAAIRRHAAATALRQQADRLGRQRENYLRKSASPQFARTPLAATWRDFAQQSGVEARKLRAAAQIIIEEGWEHQCAAETPATREDPAEGCETPVENEGDYCPRHEPADDYDPRGEL